MTEDHELNSGSRWLGSANGALTALLVLQFDTTPVLLPAASTLKGLQKCTVLLAADC